MRSVSGTNYENRNMTYTYVEDWWEINLDIPGRVDESIPGKDMLHFRVWVRPLPAGKGFGFDGLMAPELWHDQDYLQAYMKAQFTELKARYPK